MRLSILLAATLVRLAVSMSINDKDGRNNLTIPCPNPLNYPWDTDDYECPHKHVVNAQGACLDGLARMPGQNYCVALCEKLTSWFPGKEQPFDTSCAANSPCMLNSGTTVSYGNSYGTNLELTVPGPADYAGNFDSLKNQMKHIQKFPLKWVMSGANYQYTDQSMYETMEMHYRQTNSSQYCGYFTFVPYYIRSCGIVTTSGWQKTSLLSNPKWWPGWAPNLERGKCLQNVQQTTPDVCASWPLVINGKSQGQVLWVNTDCEGGGLLPMEYQAAMYAHNGVHEGFIKQHWVPDNSTDSSSTSSSSMGNFCSDPHAIPGGSGH